jgi:hypothetical protein
VEPSLVVSNPGSIDTGKTGNNIKSMQFISPNDSQEMLLLAGTPSFGCQIYERFGLNYPPTFQLQRSFNFEDSEYENCCVVKGDYFFAMP